MTLHDAAKAVAVANALLAGGIGSIELTMRTEAAEASLKAISASVPGILLGAGTVLSVAQGERALANLAKHCKERSLKLALCPSLPEAKHAPKSHNCV